MPSFGTIWPKHINIQSDYQQTISMAKKSIRYSGDDAFIAQNWELVKQAGREIRRCYSR